MPLYIGNKKVCPIVPTWRGFWSVTVYGFPGTIVDCGTQKTIGEDGRAVFRFAEAGTYTFIGMLGTETDVKEVELVEGEYIVEKYLYVGVTVLEYIESTGTQWFETGVKFTPDNFRIDLDFEPTAFTETVRNGLFGDINNSADRSLTIDHVRPAVSPEPEIRVSIGRITYGSSLLRLSDTIGTRASITVSTSSTEIALLDNTTGRLVSQEITGTVTYDTNLMLFNSTRIAQDGLPYIGRLYKYRLYKNNDLIQSFIPARRNSDNKVGMIDLVSREFFHNAGTGEFIPGPEVA